MRQGRLDPWRASIDAQSALQARLDEVANPETDPEARHLMAQVALAKATSFIALLRDDGRILDVTDAPLTSAGLDRHEVIGSYLWQTPWCRHSEEVQADLRRALELAADGRLSRFDVELMMGSGGTVSETVDLVLRPLRAADGRVAFIVAEGRQVSDRKRAEERIARQNAELSVLTDRLARIHNFREQLLAELSHDLRAPMQVVLTRAERLQRHPRRDIVKAEAQGIRLAALDALEQVDAMLEQVRRDHGEARLALVDADLAANVRAVAEQFDALASERGVRIVVETPDQALARFDPERISRGVSNLLANALRFAAAGGVARCTLAIDGDSAVIEVADSGAGVLPEQRELLFERYRTADNGRSGTGLGLAIVREFVALHGGTVAIGEAPEGGALFTVRIPREPAASEPAPMRLSQQLAAARRARYVKEHLEAELAGRAPAELAELDLPSVLLVDRDPERTVSLADALEGRAGVFTASEATEALRLATDLQPDMVVIGRINGESSATALLDRMAREWKLAGVLRVALVERGADAAVRKGLQAAGAQDFIAEPLGSDELGARFGLLLEHAALRRRAEAAEAELRRLRGGGGATPR